MRTRRKTYTAQEALYKRILWSWRKRVTRQCNIPQTSALRREAGGQTQRAYEGPGANTPSGEAKVRPNRLYKRADLYIKLPVSRTEEN